MVDAKTLIKLEKNHIFLSFEKGLQSLKYMRIVGVESEEMVGKCSRKEPMGEVDK